MQLPQNRKAVPEKKDGLDMIIKNIDSGVWQHIEFK